MQNKGFVRIFALLLTLVCIFYLSFSFVTSRYMNKAEEYAAGDRVKMAQYIDSLSTEKVWLGYTFKQCREMEVGLGLDLKGGMNVILELSVPDVIKSLSNNNPDPTFNQAVENASKRHATTSQDFLSVFLDEYTKLDPGAKLSAIFSTFELKDRISPASSNAEVITVLRTEMEAAISNSFNVLRTRIDRFGVVSPNIQRLETDGRILIELPGVKEPERVRKLLQGSANLEFWETYDLPEIYQAMVAANNVIRDLKANKTTGETPADSASSVVDSTKTAAVTVAPADSTLATNATDTLLQKVTGEDPTNVDLAANRAQFEKDFPLFALLQINQDQSGRMMTSPVVGTAHKNDMEQISEMLNMKQVRDVLPRNLQFKWTVKAIDEKDIFYQLIAIKVTNRDGHAPLGGEVVTDARSDFGQNSSFAEVSMTMNSEGAKTWARLTKENIGKSIAIVLDDLVYSFPRVNDEITGGRSQITGNFTTDEAGDLANVLKSGKMAASVKIIQEDIVGPSLGQEAINSGIISFIIALVLLMIYMTSIYGFVPGMIANIGVMVNLFFTMGILASFQAVLTLSGIAGLVLSMGVAVDANVLIYERTKEELRAGKNLKKAISDGYENAFSAIFDANLTSIITGVILFMFGTGPIKGFATTLIIGIITSFFTAVFMTRMVYETGLDKGWFKNLTFATSFTKNLLVNTKIDFVKLRKKGYIFSAILIVIFIISFVTRGLNQGIDFTGGRNYVIRFDHPVNTEDLQSELSSKFGTASLSVITIGGENQVRITTNYKIEESNATIDDEVDGLLFEGLKKELKEGTTKESFVSDYIQSSQKVGPAIAKDITYGAIWALFLSTIAMGLYILFRFRDLSFSLGTVASLLHDTLIIIGVYSLFYGIIPFSMEIDQAFIAAILTVIGYSVNDTVVIFDRIREIIGLYPKRSVKRRINDALNTTLARTFSTSLSTAIVLLCIFILGGDTIRSFTFALLFGVFMGTYSTLFIAVPVAYEIQIRKKGAKVTDDEDNA
ncbi:MAG: protein translocase subunit SecDF [Bacteroidales bacterium]